MESGPSGSISVGDNANVVAVTAQSSLPPVAPTQKGKKLTSAVWKSFKRETSLKEVNGKQVKQIKAICNICSKEFDGGSTKGTTHLSNHLKLHANTINGQQTLSYSSHTTTNAIVATYKYDEAVSIKKLATAVLMHEYPFSFVEHKYTVDFVKSLCPKFNMKSAKSIRSEIFQLYDVHKKVVYDKFCSLCCRISLTMDLWTSSKQNKGYMCVTAHFIDDDWCLQKRIINFMQLGGSHTGLRLSQAFIKNLYDWNIDRKVFSLTLDNDRANDVCVKEVVKRLNLQKSLVHDGLFCHVRCVAHIINLVVRDGMALIKDSIDGVRDMVLTVRGSPKQWEEFQKKAKEDNLDISRGLSSDVSTRWNSTYFMLSDALYYKNAFVRHFGGDPVMYTKCPSDDEWAFATKLCACLKTFHSITELLSGTLYPTANLFFQEFCEVHLQLIEWTKSSDTFLFKMGQAMKEKFTKYWRKTNHILAVASFLDPRYKFEMVGYYYPLIYDSNGNGNGNDQMAEIHQIVTSLYDEYRRSSPSTARQSLHGVLETSQRESQPNSHDTGLGSFNDRKRKFTEHLLQKCQQQPKKTDLDLYIEESTLPWTTDSPFDILSWWKVEGSKFPILSKIARDVLAIPVSTVASESAFSTGGRVVDAFRSRLAPETVEKLICTQDWIRATSRGPVPTILHDFEEGVIANEESGASQSESCTS